MRDGDLVAQLLLYSGVQNNIANSFLSQIGTMANAPHCHGWSGASSEGAIKATRPEHPRLLGIFLCTPHVSNPCRWPVVRGRLRPKDVEKVDVNSQCSSITSSAVKVVEQNRMV